MTLTELIRTPIYQGNRQTGRTTKMLLRAIVRMQDLHNVSVILHDSCQFSYTMHLIKSLRHDAKTFAGTRDIEIDGRMMRLISYKAYDDRIVLHHPIALMAGVASENIFVDHYVWERQHG